MGDITIDEDDLTDEDDLMDQDDDEASRRRREQNKRPRTSQYKYKELLQNLADRSIDELTVDLDDLATVSETAQGAVASESNQAPSVGKPK